MADLRISHTGIRPGEFITNSSTGSQNKGSVLQIMGFYPPSKKRVEELEEHIIKDSFTKYEFFSNMKTEERKEWLINNSTDNDDLYLQDVDLKVKVIKFTGSLIKEKLTPEQISLIIQGNPDDPEGWSIKALYGIFPRKPGSKAYRHSLIFRPSNWSLMETKASSKSVSGYIIDPITINVINSTITSKKGEQILDFDYGGQKIYIHYPVSANVPDFDKMWERLGFDKNVIISIKSLISWFPPSLYKSLIQKIIRTSCANVEYSGINYPSHIFLAVAFELLYLHPGVTLPELQNKFVSGAESASKRMAVSISEDSYTSDYSLIASMLCHSYVAQNGEKWHPGDDVIEKWVIAGINSISEGRTYKYDTKCKSEEIKAWDPYYIGYLVLKSIGSFESDINMMISIADNNGSTVDPAQNEWYKTDKVMPLIHCVDQHSFTDIAHYFNPSYIPSYGELFKAIWDYSVGWNPRKENYRKWYLQSYFHPFQNAVKDAQAKVWISRTYKHTELKPAKKKTRYKIQISDSWLASFVGITEITVSRVTYVAMLDPNNLGKVKIIKKPPRENDKPTKISEEEEKEVEQIFISQGIKLKNIPKTLPSFKNSKLFIDPNLGYIIDDVPWNEAKIIKESFDVYDYKLPDDDEGYVYMALTQTGHGIHVDSNKVLTKYLKNLDTKVLKRAVLYLTNFSSRIEIYHIGREGEGTKYTVDPTDTQVNILFCRLCCLYPGIIKKNKSFFDIKFGPLFWEIAKVIKNYASVSISQNVENNWEPGVEYPRVLYDHQKDSVTRLLESKNKKLNIIWIKMGLGKSAIVCKYIQQLILLREMPKYCLWIMPSEAIKSIADEISMFGLKYKHLDQRQSYKGQKNLIPGVINIIQHNHLILSDMDSLRNMAPDMLFINDEMHKTYDQKTKITAAALEISKLSHSAIAMTGTLIKDDKTEQLIEWLSMAVDFEVTEKNYWVAVASIISHRIDTGICVTRIEKIYEMKGEMKDNYLKTVPSAMGGTATKIDFPQAVKISYTATTISMLESAMQYLYAGEKLFIVSKNIEHQNEIKNILLSNGVSDVFLIEHESEFNLVDFNTAPRVTITTLHHDTGYNASAYHIMLTGVYFSSESTREQLEGRIDRLSQKSDKIIIEIHHTGILSYIHSRYERVRSLSKALENLGTEINEKLSVKDLG